MGFQKATVADVETLKFWLINDVLDNEHRVEQIREAILERCRILHIEPPTQGRIRRLFGSALQEHEKRFCNEINKSLDRTTIEGMDDFLEAKSSEEGEAEWTIWQDFSKPNLDKATLWRRLLLFIFGLGTNTGIKSMESQPEDTYKDLFYVRRRFLSIARAGQLLHTFWIEVSSSSGIH